MTALSTIWEDAAALVVAKPSGQLVHNSAWAGPRERTLVDDARAATGLAVVPVHRLDRGTSGLVVLAKSPDAARVWQRALATAEKRYLALVRGRLRAAVDVDHAIVDEDGTARAASSRVAPLLSDGPERCSLVVVTLQTGRRHQARRHLKHLSHPVLGDATYGKGPLNRDYAARFGLTRLALHAWRLDVEGRSFTAPLPDDLRAPLQRVFGDSALASVGLL